MNLKLKYKQNEDKPIINPFKYKSRKGKIDWKSINNINLTQMIEFNKIDPLNSVLQNITYSNIYIDELKDYPYELIIKLMRTMQMSLEYLLYAQNVLKKNNDQLTDKYMSLYDHNEQLEHQYAKLSKTQIDSKNSLRLEKKMTKVQEFLMSKKENMQNNELEIIEAMRSTLINNNNKLLDDKYESLMIRKENTTNDMNEVKNAVNEIKTKIDNKENIDTMDNIQIKLKEIENKVSNETKNEISLLKNDIKQVLEQNKYNNLMDKNINLLNENLEKITKITIDNNNNKVPKLDNDDDKNYRIQYLESQLQLLQEDVKKERNEKIELRDEWNKIKPSLEDTTNVQTDRSTKNLLDKLESVKNKYDSIIDRFKDIEENNNDVTLINKSYKDLINNLTIENEDLKTRFDNTTSSFKSLKSEITQLEDNQKNKLKEYDNKIQQIEVNENQQHVIKKTNCDILENDLDTSTDNNYSTNINYDINNDLLKLHQNTDRLYINYNESNDSNTMELSKTNIDDSTNSMKNIDEYKYKHLDTIKEETVIKSYRTIDSNSPTVGGRFGGDTNMFQNVDNDILEESLLEEAYSLIKKQDITQDITIKFAKGSVVDELSPCLINQLNQKKKLHNINLSRINNIEEDIMNAIKEGRQNNHFVMTNSHQMSNMCKINKLVNIQMDAYDDDKYMQSCENFINITTQAIKSCASKRLCIQINNSTFNPNLQIQLIADAIIRIIGLKINVEMITILISSIASDTLEKYIDNAIRLIQTIVNTNIIIEQKNEINEKFKEKILELVGVIPKVDINNAITINDIKNKDVVYRSIDSVDIRSSSNYTKLQRNIEKIYVSQGSSLEIQNNINVKSNERKPDYLRSSKYDEGYNTFSD